MKAKYVYESLGFQRGRDPKAALDIGGYSFDTLRSGTIIKSRKAFGTTLGGVIRGYDGAAKRISRGSYLVILDIHRSDKYYISFRYVNAGGVIFPGYSKDIEADDKKYLDKAREIQDNYINDPEYIKNRFKTRRIDKIGRVKFNNLFKIIEPPR